MNRSLRILLTLCIANLPFLLNSQGLVWTEPPFPTADDDIKLYFDASKGNGALSGFEGDVYAHMGLITAQSQSPSDWKHVIGNWGTADDRVRMNSEGDGLYSLEYNIKSFHGVPDGIEVLRLAFVFRNVDGSIVGRDTDGSDIFYDLAAGDGLAVNLLSPSAGENFLEIGDSLLIQMELNRTAEISIFDNDDLIFNDTNISVTFYIVAESEGRHTVDITLSDDDTINLQASYFVLSSIEAKDPPPALVNGPNLQSDTSIVFQLRAPQKNNVFLLCPANAFKASEDFRLSPSLDGNTFWIELPKSFFANGQNTFQYLVDGNIRIADPYSVVVLDPFNDSQISADVLSGLPEYPEGADGIVSVFDLEESTFEWQHDTFQQANISNLVIYEILMRDFLADHSYISLIDTLEYLEQLGVNAIQLMPIQEFEGNQSWGYNPSFHMAVDKYYGSRDQLKMLIDAAHEKGIAVILDVVFNHAFSQSPLAQLYWDAGSFRPTPDNPWLNVTARHPFNVGYDFNHESIWTKEWVKQVLSHWIEEFHFDGFRFDLSKGLTQTNSGSNNEVASRYDASRIAILKEYADHIWSLDNNSYVIMEHFADNQEEKELADYGMMLWGNINHEFSNAAKGFSSSLAGADYTFREWNDPHLIAYMESHDEERLMRRILDEGDREDNYNTRSLPTALERVAAASVLYYTIPGPKMIWQFGELGNESSINRCVNGSIDGNCRLDPKPILWEYFEESDRRRLYDITSALIHLKTNYPTFSTPDFTFADGNQFIKTVTLSHSEMDAISIVNFRVTESNFNPRFPYAGTWYEYFSGDSIEVTDINQRFDFEPGEYRIYTSKPITVPDIVTNSSQFHTVNEINIYPNPVVEDNLRLEINDNTIKAIQLRSIDGKMVGMLEFEYSNGLLQLSLPVPLIAGTYFVEVISANQRYIGRFLKQ